MRALIVAIAAWLLLLGLESWLGARLLASEVVAGLVSPQGAALTGLLAVGAFVLVRLLAVLVLPSFVAGLLAWVAAGRRD